MKKILIVNGNSKQNSLSHALSQSYYESAKSAGFKIELINLIDLNFDPIFRQGYDGNQELEPDLIKLQNLIRESDHLVLVYPIWWGNIPALLKGMFDRVLLPGFAFKYEKGSSIPKKLLEGKTARLITTMDYPPWYYKLAFGSPAHKMMKRTVLNFCGFNPVKITEFGPVINSKETSRLKWINEAAKLGSKGL